MPDLLSFQSQFQKRVLSQEQNVPSGLFEETDVRADIGWRVYQNNVFHSLIEALGDTFPVVRRLVGEDFFKFSAREYIKTHAPATPILLELGDGFPTFLESFEPAKNHPYLSEVARLELAWLRAYHAADSGAVDPVYVQSLTPEEMMSLTFDLTASLQLLSSNFPVFSIWQAHQGSDEFSALSLDNGGEHALILRVGLAVLVRQITAGELAFWASLQDAQSLGRAYETAILEDPDLDLGQILAFGFSNSLFASINTQH